MKTTCLILLLLTLSTGASAQPGDPDSARVVTADIERFWIAYDSIEPDATKKDSLRAFFEEYYLEASPGLRDFIRERIGSVYALVEQISTHPKYYASIRQPTLEAGSYEDEIRQVYAALDTLYDGAVFPDTYIQIGRMNSGGTLTDQRLLIGAEMYGRTPQTPTEELSDWHQAVLRPIDEIPHVVAHELIHYQQDYPDSARTLLSQSVREGSADFIAELISGRHINSHVHEWADPRERALWREFKTRMHKEDNVGWLYGGNSSTERPADLGYWIGYKIVQAYYEQAEDKRQAIRDILTIDDFTAFLERSGYAATFPE